MKEILKNVRLEKCCSDARLACGKDASESEPNGSIEGYLAVFNNVDSQGDRIIPGAFAKTIQERVSAGKCVLMVRHFAYGGDTSEVIGIITQAKEDAYGLWVHAKLAATQLAQETRSLIVDDMVKGLSIGYQVIRYESVQEGEKCIYNLTELSLLEGTVTAFPANELAQITSAKSTLQEASGAPEKAAPLSDSDAELLDLEAATMSAKCAIERAKI